MTSCMATLLGIPRTLAIIAAICVVESPAAFPDAMRSLTSVCRAACAASESLPDWATALP